MSKPAAMPVFGDAYLADTTHLTTEEHGAYFLLLLAAWRQEDCALPNDERKLARISGLSLRKWKVIAPTIMEFWTVEDGRIFQGRQRREHTYVVQKSASNRKSAEARWGKQPIENIGSGECDRNADAMPLHLHLREEEDSVGADAPTEPAGSKISPATPPTAEQVKKAIFDSGKALLTAAGAKDPGAIIAKWRRTYPDHVMLDVLTRCGGVGPEDPVSWITASLKSTLNAQWSSRNGQSSRDDNTISDPLARVAARRQAARAAEERAEPGDWSEHSG